MTRILAAGALLLITAACRPRSEPSVANDLPGVAVMRSASGEELGTLHVVPSSHGGARIHGKLKGIPKGRHGFHVHSIGRCDGTDFDAAGDHFNPRDRDHGLLNPDGPHAGDAPNLRFSSSGRATVDVGLPRALLTSSSDSAGLWDKDGSSIIIHANEDDQRTDPAGKSGARIACGVLTQP